MKTVRLLFSDPMARAIVEGRKVVTRRPVDFRKLPHGVIEECPGFGPWPFWEDEDGDWHPETRQAAPGDLLIGRECWRPHVEAGATWVTYRAGGPSMDVTFDKGPRGLGPLDKVGSLAYSVARRPADGNLADRGYTHWESSMVMPDWAARICRRVVSVTVERVQDITEEDAVREGFWSSGNGETYRPALATFADAWDSIYAAKGIGWAANPWVWRIEFSAENVAT